MKNKTILLGLIAIIIILGVITLNNLNSYTFYTFTSNNKEFIIRGSATFTKTGSVLTTSKISYEGPKREVTNVKVEFYKRKDDTIIIGEERTSSEPLDLREAMTNFEFNNYESYGYNELFNKTISRNFLNEVYVKITYTDSDIHEYTLNLDGNKYQSKLFYLKTKHI